MNEYAEQYGFAVLYPYQNNFRNMNNCWHWFNASERHGLKEKHSIVEIVASLLAVYDFIEKGNGNAVIDDIFICIICPA